MQFLRQATRLAPRLAPQLKPTVSVGSKRYIQGIFDKPSFEQLFENNRKWVAEQKKNDPDYFKNLAKGQSPKYLFIGCADSRIPAQEVLGLKCGELFVHRNVANLVVNGDMNLLAVLQYSVEVLKVEDIIVCGHYECGGIKAACANHDHGLVEHWLRNIRDINRLHAEELEAIECEERGTGGWWSSTCRSSASTSTPTPSCRRPSWPPAYRGFTVSCTTLPRGWSRSCPSTSRRRSARSSSTTVCIISRRMLSHPQQPGKQSSSFSIITTIK
ncbi:unnamed protein product [Heterosigma akashiwo]